MFAFQSNVRSYFLLNTATTHTTEIFLLFWDSRCKPTLKREKNVAMIFFSYFWLFAISVSATVKVSQEIRQYKDVDLCVLSIQNNMTYSRTPVVVRWILLKLLMLKKLQIHSPFVYGFNELFVRKQA